ncbi:transmembrane and TPR repeat-containing protein [Acrasis kona]|uniref:Transmembrane and TPR repeat-containing protein n=1 Tax=Acrasis kona TaxID=1008807 RepID=A0AAW2ZCQ7_9EUKA
MRRHNLFCISKRVLTRGYTDVRKPIIIDFSRKNKKDYEFTDVMNQKSRDQKTNPAQTIDQTTPSSTPIIDEKAYSMYFDIAKEHLREGNLSKSTEVLSECIKHWHSNPIPYVHRGRAYLQKGEIDLGLKDLKKAIELSNQSLTLSDHDLADVHYNLGIVYLNRGMKDSSLLEYNKCINCIIKNNEIVDPDSKEILIHAFNNRGHLLLQSKPDQALLDFEKAFDYIEPDSYTSPEYTSLRFNKAKVLYLLGRQKESKNDFDNLLDIMKWSKTGPKVDLEISVRTILINLCLSLGDLSEASNHLNESITKLLGLRTSAQLDQDKSLLRDCDAQLHRLYKIRYKSFDDSSVSDINNCIKHCKMDSEPFYDRAMLNIKNKLYDDAIFDLTAALQRFDPTDPYKTLLNRRDIEVKRAECYEFKGDWYSAIMDYKSAINDLGKVDDAVVKSSVAPAIHVRIAILYLRCNAISTDYSRDVGEALRSLTSAINTSERSFVDAYHHRYHVYQQLHQQQCKLSGLDPLFESDDEGYHRRAVSDMEKVIQLTEDSSVVNNSDQDEKLRMIHRLIMRQQALTNIGIANLYILKNYSSACSNFEESLNIINRHATEIGQNYVTTSLKRLYKLLSLSNFKVGRYVNSGTYLLMLLRLNKK